MVICLEQDADLHKAQLMPLPLTVSCSSKIQIGFTFLVPADLGSPGQRTVKRMYVCMFWPICLMAGAVEGQNIWGAGPYTSLPSPAPWKCPKSHLASTDCGTRYGDEAVLPAFELCRLRCSKTTKISLP